MSYCKKCESKLTEVQELTLRLSEAEEKIESHIAQEDLHTSDMAIFGVAVVAVGFASFIAVVIAQELIKNAIH